LRFALSYRKVVTSRATSVEFSSSWTQGKTNSFAGQILIPGPLSAVGPVLLFLTRSAFARCHRFDVHLKTSAIVDDVEGIMQDARRDQLFWPVRC
jgi:hypothetical protein